MMLTLIVLGVALIVPFVTIAQIRHRKENWWKKTRQANHLDDDGPGK